MRIHLLALPFIAACGGLASMDDPRGEECGDGWLDPSEQCDLGGENSNEGECTTFCRLARCGDGYRQGGETCDDGNDDPDDDCREDCTSPFDFTWAATLLGAETVAAATNGSLYVAGEISPPDGGEAVALAVIDGETGAITLGEPWYALPVLAWTTRGRLDVAARPGGGAVVGVHFSFSGEPPVGVAGWFDVAGALEARYESPSLGVTYNVNRVAMAPSGEAILGGSYNDHGWGQVLEGDVPVWQGQYAATGDVVVTSVDLDSALHAVVAGYRAPQIDPFIAVDDGGGNLDWSAITQRVDLDSYEDVRFANSTSFWVIHARRLGSTRAAVETRSRSNGAVQSMYWLAIPNFLDLKGARLLPDGRALTWGRTQTAHWLVLHGPAGEEVWRANPVQIPADIVDADASPDGKRIYAIVGGVAVAGWHVPE